MALGRAVAAVVAGVCTVFAAVAVTFSAAGVAAGGAGPASAATGAAPFPGNTRSHYLTTTSLDTLRSTGRRDAADARRVGIARALVVLDAGSPAGPDGSVRLPDTGQPAAPSDVAGAAVTYGLAWAAAAGPPLVLVIGTTNDGSAVGAAHGAAWGRLVGGVARRLAVTGIDVRGGIDAEMEFGRPAGALAWVRGYLGATDRGYVDFGSCTCPPSARPPGGWTLRDRWAVATGDGRGAVLPEIYATGGGNAREWAALVGWSRRHHRDRPVRLLGVLSESAACTGPPVRACAGIDLPPQRAWAQLAAALGRGTAGATGLRYASDIGYLPHGGPVRGPLAPVGGPLGLAALVIGAAVVSTAVTAYRLRRRAGVRRPHRGNRLVGARRRRRSR